MGHHVHRTTRVPQVGVLRDRPQRLLLAAAADHDRQVRLDRGRAGGGGRRRCSGRPARMSPTRHRATARIAATDSSSQSRRWPKPLPKSMPWAWCSSPNHAPPMPRMAPTLADVVERRRRLRHETGIAERVRADEQTELRLRGLAGPRRQQRPAFEDGLVRVAEDRVEVVPCPEVRVAEAVHALRRIQHLGPAGALAPEQDAGLEVGHGGSKASGRDEGTVRF